MAIFLGIAVVSTLAAMLWLTHHNIYLHIAVFAAAIGAAFAFGALFGLSGGFLTMIGEMVPELVLIKHTTRISVHA